MCDLLFEWAPEGVRSNRLDDAHAASVTLGTAWSPVDFNCLGLMFGHGIVRRTLNFLGSGDTEKFSAQSKLLLAKAIGGGAEMPDTPSA